MSSNSEPNWDLLPEHPELFFQLTEPFDRKDLKRAYNALIRRFKPEKCPAEFQKIRAAYDEVDRRLRYGAESEFPLPVPGNTDDLTHEQVRELEAALRRMARRRETNSDERRQILTALETADPRAWYGRLKSQTSRSPTEYLFLAFLSDFCENNPLALPRWLLAGLEEHPHSGELLALLQEVFRTIPGDQLVTVLKATANAVKGDQFYFLTEAAWLRLLDIVPFDQFAEALRDCESRLSDIRNRGQLVFYVQILRKAMWFADGEWLKAIQSVIDENQLELAEHLGYELEMNDVLLDYIRVRDRFLNGNPIRAGIDRTIYRYCVMDDLPALQEYLTAQQRLNRAGQELLDAFPIGEMPYNPVYAPWCWLAQETEQQIGHERRELKPRELTPKIGRLLQDIDEKTRSGRTGFAWKRFHATLALVYFLFVGAIPAGAAILTSFWTGEYRLPIGIVTLLGLALPISRWVSPAIELRLRSRWGEKLAKRSYIEVWRREISDFLQVSFIPVEDVLRVIEAFEQDYPTATRYQYIHWVSLFLQQDFGLAFYSLSQQFQK